MYRRPPSIFSALLAERECSDSRIAHASSCNVLGGVGTMGRDITRGMGIASGMFFGNECGRKRLVLLPRFAHSNPLLFLSYA